MRHERAAMKVGTDGVLLGAWCRAEQPTRILDVGTGCGLIALMLAQRFPHALIHAVEIDPGATLEAETNFRASPWPSRFSLYSGDICAIPLPNRYSMIVSNPPWYDSEMKSPEQVRSKARHSESLAAEDLMSRVADLLDDQGKFCAIIPVDKAPRLIDAAAANALYIRRQTLVRPTPLKPPHRRLLEFSRPSSSDRMPMNSADSDELIVETEVRHHYTAEFQSLLKEFFLRF